MSFKISEFRNNISSLARPNLWRAELDMNNNFSAPSSFSFRCEKTVAPGRTLSTIDEIGFGPALKLPYETTYDDIDVTIICAQDMSERKFFEEWMDRIVYPGKSTVDSNIIKPGIIKFYSDYAEGNILSIYQLNESNQEIFKHTIRNVYPIRLSPMNLSWEETNTYQRFDVTFAYQYYEWEIPEAA